MSQLFQDGIDHEDVATYGYRSDRWNFVEGEALAGIVNKLNKEQNRYVISATNSRVVWRTLLFYPGATLVRVTDLSWRPRALTLYFIGLRGQYRRLDGSRSFIRFINEHIPLKLTAQTAIEYLRFYCFFMRHQGRPFLLVEKLDDIGHFAVPLTDEQKQQVTGLLHPVTITKEDPQEGYTASAVVRFGHNLFESVFQISPEGNVRMVEDTELPTSIADAKGSAVAELWGA